MAVNNDAASKLVQEGMDLSSDIIGGIYASKRRKLITLLISVLIVLAAIIVVLWKVGYLNVAIAVGVAGIIGLALLLIHSVKELHELKRELDALNHYINY